MPASVGDPQGFGAMASAPEDLQHAAAALVQRLRRGSSDEQAAAAEQLADMAQRAPGGAAAAAGAGAVAALMQLLPPSERPSPSSCGSDGATSRLVTSTTLSAALHGLTYLMTMHIESRGALAVADGIAACVRLIRTPPSSSVQEWALRLLWSCCYDSDSNKAAIIDAGATPDIVSALGCSDAGVRQAAVVLLVNLATSSACVAAARAAGGIPALLRCLKDAGTQQYAAAALANMAMDAACREIIADWVRTVVRCLADGSPAAQLSAADALVGLTQGAAFGNLIAVVVEQGAVPPLLQLSVGSGSTTFDAQLAAIAALHSLSFSAAGCAVLTQAGATVTLAEMTCGAHVVLRAHRAELEERIPPTMATVCRTLLNLVSFSEHAWLTSAGQQVQTGASAGPPAQAATPQVLLGPAPAATPQVLLGPVQAAAPQVLLGPAQAAPPQVLLVPAATVRGEETRDDAG